MTTKNFIKQANGEIFLTPIGTSLDDLMIECQEKDSTKNSRWNARLKLEKNIKFFLTHKLQEMAEVARKEVLDMISSNEGWEESRDFYAKKLGLKLKY